MNEISEMGYQYLRYLVEEELECILSSVRITVEEFKQYVSVVILNVYSDCIFHNTITIPFNSNMSVQYLATEIINASYNQIAEHRKYVLVEKEKEE